MHGYAGRGAQIASFIKPLLASGYRVLSYDAPAHGSTAGKSSDAYELADTLQAIIQEYGPFEGIIVHSFGGVLFGLQEQEQFRDCRLVLLSVPKNYQTILASYQRSFSISNDVGQKFTHRLKNNFGEHVLADLTTLNRTPKFVCNTLVIHDEDDQYFPLESGKAVAQSIKKSKFMLGIRHIFTGFRDKGAIFENIVFSMIKHKNPRYVYQNGIELDLMTDDNILIEVKYGQELKEKQQALFDTIKAKRKIVINGFKDLEILKDL